MKYALVEGQRREAERGLSGVCELGHSMIPKCGAKKMKHWAHQNGSVCDHWWENETEWHRNWKNQFPVEWQERVHHAESGERHYADVKTDKDWVIEFQYSLIAPEERQSRNAFYKKLIWVVSGMRRKTDATQFSDALKRFTPLNNNPLIIKVSVEDCRLLTEWADTNGPVFFDFSEPARLWWRFPKTPDGSIYVAPFSRAAFIDLHRSGATQDFEKFLSDFGQLMERRTQPRPAMPRPQAFQNYPYRMDRSRRRF